MPARSFKSLAEQTRLRRLVDEGKFPEGEFSEMLDASRGLALPERATTKGGRMTTKPGQASRRYAEYEQISSGKKKGAY